MGCGNPNNARQRAGSTRDCTRDTAHWQLPSHLLGMGQGVEVTCQHQALRMAGALGVPAEGQLRSALKLQVHGVWWQGEWAATYRRGS